MYQSNAFSAFSLQSIDMSTFFIFRFIEQQCVDEEVDVLADFVDGATQQVLVTVPELRGLIGEASPVLPAGPGYRALAAMQTTSGRRVTCGQSGTDVIATPQFQCGRRQSTKEAGDVKN